MNYLLTAIIIILLIHIGFLHYKINRLEIDRFLDDVKKRKREEVEDGSGLSL